jgi:glycosyltransferase involved in cell wall biosynthesis
MKKILLLSAYRSDSHDAWVDWLTRNIENVDWQVLALPGRHFAWRIRGNPLSWIDRIPADVPDLLLATSMVDLATLKGLHPQLARIPAWYYFHENQFAYPITDRQVTSIEARIVQLYGALAADRLLFNSSFNRDSFLAGIDDFLGLMPDGIPDGVRQRLEPRCHVQPVPVLPIAPAQERDHRLIVWNHRWEYDKNPELFADAMLGLAEQGIDFRLALLGKRPRAVPEALARLREALSNRIVADGRLDEDEYRALLGRSGIAVSTAIHEFQGISMLEAASAGARPLVPDALCYPEQYSAEYRYPAGNIDALVTRLHQWLTDSLPPPCPIDRWLAPATGARWRRELHAAPPLRGHQGEHA